MYIYIHICTCMCILCAYICIYIYMHNYAYMYTSIYIYVGLYCTIQIYATYINKMCYPQSNGNPGSALVEASLALQREAFGSVETVTWILTKKKRHHIHIHVI